MWPDPRNIPKKNLFMTLNKNELNSRVTSIKFIQQIFLK